MTLNLDIPVWINLCSGLLAFGLYHYLMSHESMKGMAALRILMASLAWWAMLNAFELAVTDIPLKILLSKLAYIGTVTSVPAWTAFAITYRNKTNHIRKALWFFMGSTSLLMIVSVFTNELHHSVWTTVVPDPAGTGNRLIYDHGTLFFVYAAVAYTLMLYGTFVLIRASLADQGLRRWQGMLLITAAVIPLAGNVLYILHLMPWPSLDPTPITFIFTGFAFTIGILRFRLFKLLPIARDRLFDSLQDGVIVLDRDGIIADLNRMAGVLLELAPEEDAWSGKQLDEIWPDLAAHVLDRNRRDDRPSPLHTRMGSWLDVRVAELVDSSGMAEGSILTLRNVTRLKQAEAQLLREKKMVEEAGNLAEEARTLAEEAKSLAERERQEAELARQAADAANQAKTTFLANLSHEMRTPLVAITGFLHLLTYTEMERVQRQYVREIGLASEALLSLVNEILDISRVEAGGMELESLPFRLDRLVEECAALLSVRIVGKPINLAVSIETELQEVEGDPGRTRQMILNLLGNAVKFTAKGEILVVLRDADPEECATISQPMGQRIAAIEVRDTGMGIPEEVQARLFEPFIQAERSTARKYGGSGLGLAITRRIAELMGGHVLLSSVLGSGSRFTLVLPFPVHGEAGSEETDASHDMLAGKHVMILSAWQTNRKILSAYLKKAGCVVQEAVSENQMWDLLGREPAHGLPDFLLIDDGHSDFDGHAVRHRMLMDFRKSTIHCILLAPPASREEGRETIDSAFDALLLKPIRRGELLQIMGEILSGRGESGGSGKTGRHLAALSDYPGKDARHVLAQSGRSARDAQSVSLTDCRVLLVEDTEANRRLIGLLLERFGCLVRMAANGQEAVQAVDGEKPDIILMDCQMPVMDGMEATRRIRQKEAEGTHVPILAMTANDMEGEREACLEAGMDDFMPKPVSPQRLAAVLRQWRPYPGSETL